MFKAFLSGSLHKNVEKHCVPQGYAVGAMEKKMSGRRDKDDPLVGHRQVQRVRQMGKRNPLHKAVQTRAPAQTNALPSSPWDLRGKQQQQQSSASPAPMPRSPWELKPSPQPTSQTGQAPEQALPANPWEIKPQTEQHQQGGVPTQGGSQVADASGHSQEENANARYTPANPWDVERRQNPYASLQHLSKQEDRWYVEDEKPGHWPEEIRPAERGWGPQPEAEEVSRRPKPRRSKRTRDAAIERMVETNQKAQAHMQMYAPPFEAPAPPATPRPPEYSPLDVGELDDWDVTLGADGAPIMVSDDFFDEMEQMREDPEVKQYGLQDALGDFDAVLLEDDILDIGGVVDPFDVGHDTLVYLTNPEDLIAQGEMMGDDEEPARHEPGRWHDEEDW